MPFLKYDEFQPPFYKKLVAQLITTKETSDEIPQKIIDVQKLLPGLWNNKIGVSSDLKYISSACVVDSHLEMKTAIVHPRLKREIAYLDQIEITPLLMMVEPAQTFGTIVHQWSKRIPLKQAISIAIFLWDRGIFCLDN